MSAPQPTWRHGLVWLSQPPGIVILSTHEHVTVESGGRLLMGMRLRRPEGLAVLLDEVVVAVGVPDGIREQVVSPTTAREFATAGHLDAAGTQINIGQLLLAAFEDHCRRYHEARAAARAGGLQ